MATQAVSVPKQRWLRIIPVAALMYTIAYMDRINIGFALPGLEKDLGFSSQVAGLAAGIFFVGYMFLQVPGGVLATKWSAKKFVAIMLLFWGIFAVLTGLVQNTAELLIARFFLGVAEGGVWPATLVLLANWFPNKERGRANSYWIFCQPIAAIIMSPLSGWILTWGSWRTLFILEGFPPLIWAAVWWFMVEDEPNKAKWVSPEERAYLSQAFEEDRRLTPPMSKQSRWTDVFKSGKVWWLVVAYFLIQVGFYGLTLWLPVMVQSLSKQGIGLVGLLAALPFVAALIGLYINANHSDRTGERKMHVAFPLIIGAICLLLSGLLGTSSAVLGIIFLILAEGFIFSYAGLFWTLPPLFLNKETVGAGIGLINALGNLGGFLGPFIIGYFITASGTSLTGIIILCIALVSAGSMLLLFRYERPVAPPERAVAREPGGAKALNR